MINNILVVCIGNICRSPMAESLLKQALPELQVTSAGLEAMVGWGADPTSVKIMSEQGCDISAHRARMLSEIGARDSDLILVMDNQQRKQIEQQYPFTRGKVFRLGESIDRDIPDPYREGEAAFQSSFELIAKGCDAWVDRIRIISKK